LKFLKKVAAAYPAQELHVVCDNYSTHKHAEVKAWLVKNPRITLHFTPTGYSWLNLVEFNRPWGKSAVMAGFGYRVIRLRWPWILAMTRECRATSVGQPRWAASSRSAVMSASWAWSCGMNSVAVT